MRNHDWEKSKPMTFVDYVELALALAILPAIIVGLVVILVLI